MALLQRFSLVILLFTLVACGGSEGSFTNTDTDIDDSEDLEGITLSLAISNQNVTEQSPATVTVTVTEDGEPLEGQLITFTIDRDDLGSFQPETGTAISKDNGEASVTLFVGELAGAGEITASLTTGEEDTIPFNSQGASDVEVRIGSGEPFVENIALLGQNQISAGATTSISVKLVDEAGELYKEQVDVNFTSICSEETVPSAIIDEVISTSSGEAEANYLAKGCVGDDPITVNAIVNGVNLSAKVTISVLPADVGSISFVSSTPETIGIIGTGAVGGAESSTIIFKVVDTNGNAVNNQTVDFSLSTATGNVTLNPVSAETNNEGLVQTVVNSGSVATTVRVNASVADSSPLIASQSSVLVVSTGIPDQDSFSLSADILNPEAWDTDGTIVNVTARLADAFNNPAPDGTAVNFTTEGGSIEPSCVTVDGACSVKWESQYPRPEGHVLGDDDNRNHEPEVANTMGQKYGGRVTILATAIGEESFADLNGNGRFDENEMAAFLGNDVSGQPYDRKEAFVDHNEDGFYNPLEDDDSEEMGGELEEFSDFDNDGDFTPNDGVYNGVLCSIPAHDGCSVNNKSINVRGEIVLVMSGSNARFVTTEPEDGADIIIFGEETANASVIISDLHNQPMPAGSQIEFSVAGNGSIVSDVPGDWANDNHNGGQEFSVTIKGVSDDLPKSGTLWVKVTTPLGVISSYPVANILIQ